jgi:hypothetical protein
MKKKMRENGFCTSFCSDARILLRLSPQRKITADDSVPFCFIRVEWDFSTIQSFQGRSTLFLSNPFCVFLPLFFG